MSGGSLDRLRVVYPAASSEQFELPENAEQLWRLFLADKAENTRRNHETDLRCFAAFAGTSTVQEAIARLLQCSAAEANKTMISYQAWLYQVQIYTPGSNPETDEPDRIGYAPATVNRRIYAIRSVVELARLCGLVGWQIQVKMRAPETQRDTSGCGTDGYAAILHELEEAIHQARGAGRKRDLEIALRDRVLIRTLHDGTIRRKEAIIIEWPRGVRLDQAEAFTLGKGKKRYEWIYVGRLWAEAVEEYLSIRGRRKGYLILSTHPSHRGKGLNLSTVNRRVEHWAELAKQRVTPHGLRHTALTRALDETGGNYRLVSKMGNAPGPDTLRAHYDDRGNKITRKLVDLVADPSTARSDDELLAHPVHRALQGLPPSDE